MADRIGDLMAQDKYQAKPLSPDDEALLRGFPTLINTESFSQAQQGWPLSTNIEDRRTPYDIGRDMLARDMHRALQGRHVMGPR